MPPQILEQFRTQVGAYGLENRRVRLSDEKTVLRVIQGARAEAVDRTVGGQQDEKRTLAVYLKDDGESANVVAALVGSRDCAYRDRMA